MGAVVQQIAPTFNNIVARHTAADEIARASLSPLQSENASKLLVLYVSNLLVGRMILPKPKHNRLQFVVQSGVGGWVVYRGGVTIA